MKNNLFNDSEIRKYAKDKAFQLTIKKHDFLKTHAEKVEKGDFKSERSSYLYFYDFLRKVLGYSREENILFEDKEDIGRGKVEFVLKSDDKKFMVIELKDQTTDLDKPQARMNDKRTPIDQAFSYAQHSDPDNPIDWIMVSNFKEFRLYNYNKRSAKCISFTYEELLNKDIFKQFMVSFSRKSHIEKDYPTKILESTLITEQKLEKNFYQLFHETRLMLTKELEEVNDLSRSDAVHYAQLILNRYMFIAFAEDTGLLRSQISTDTIITPIIKGNLRHRSIWQRLNELFLDINEGNEYKKIPAYNGGLFEEDLDFIKVRDIVEDQEIFQDTWQKWDFDKQEENIKNQLGPQVDIVNPIYKNLLIISSFDFSSELDVNILGHIFENSIGDLEELKEDSKGRRKKEGIFYTPDYITDYICKNTIIPYLSRSGDADNVNDLIGEYSWGSDIEELDQKLANIKIVDPACGSGAFLNKATDILLQIHEAIFDFKKGFTKKTQMRVGRGKRRKTEDISHFDMGSIVFDAIEKRREILLSNIYGVDLNEESVEITKLSLFLKVCTKDKKLPALDNNIKCGNSLIDDPEYSDKPFIWNKEFKEIFNDGGFNIVIGNPPYVRADVDNVDYQKQREWIKKSGKYETVYEKWDLYIPFIEKGLKILNKEGVFSFIISNSFNTVKFADKSKKYILNNFSLTQIDFFKKIEVFQGVGVESVILTIKNSKSKVDTERILHEKSFENIVLLKPSNDIEKIFRISEEIEFDGKFTNTEFLGNICYISKGMVLNADEKKHKGEFRKNDLISDFKTKVNTRPYIEASDIERYNIKRIRYLEWGTNRCPSKVSRPTFPELYIHPKIMRGNTAEAIFDKGELVCNHGIYILILFNSLKDVKNKSILANIHKWTSKKRDELDKISLNYDLRYIFAIINSKFAKFYLNTIRRHRIEYYFYPDDLKKLPIKKIPFNKQEQFVQKTKIMSESNNKLQNEVNGFKHWIQKEFNVEKLSKKLEKYYELSVDDFIEEMRKKKVDTKSRKNREYLEREFNESLKIINPLLQKIKETDDEIDRMVYDLYGLNDDEIHIIEESLKS